MTNHKIVRPARPTSKPKVKAPKPPPTGIKDLSIDRNRYAPGELNIHDLYMKEILCKCNDVLHLQGDWLSGYSLSCSNCGFFLSLKTQEHNNEYYQNALYRIKEILDEI